MASCGVKLRMIRAEPFPLTCFADSTRTNIPETEIRFDLEIFTAAAPVLLSAMVSLTVVETGTDPKSTLDGLIVSELLIALPFKGIVSDGLFGSSPETMSEPVNVPTLVGEKFTLTEPDVPADTIVPPLVASENGAGPAFVFVALIVKTSPPVLFIVKRREDTSNTLIVPISTVS